MVLFHTQKKVEPQFTDLVTYHDKSKFDEINEDILKCTQTAVVELNNFLSIIA
jgi:hypothetical protein